ALVGFAVLSGTSIIVLGCCVLLLWLVSSRLWRIPAGLLTVNPTVAIMLLKSGLSLRLATHEERGARRLGQFCALLVLGLASLSLLAFFDPGFDVSRLLFRSRLQTLYPSVRVTPNTALILTLTSLSLLILDLRGARGVFPAELLSVCGLGVALLTLVAYGYGIQPLLPGRQTLALTIALLEINSALGFALLALGILCARPSRGLMALTISEDPGGETVRHLLPAMIMVPTTLAWVRIGALQAGIYKSDAGSPIFALASVLIFIVLILWNAQSLHKASEERRRAERETQTAAKMKEEFISIVSHELRTPLASIKVGIDMVLMQQAVQTDKRQFLEISKRNVDRLAHLINEVLDFRRLDAGKETFKRASTDLNKLAADVTRTFEPPAKDKGLRIELDLTPGLPAVICDGDKIAQVVANLVNNAVKFSARGVVTVRTEQSLEGVRISVKDQGPGISAENQERLFKSFAQIPVEGRRKEGAGLGLAISRSIVEQHSGRIGLESAPGQGATFFFHLPLSATPRP
ncbi:MAG: HAMP domain-containing histidine kinase, partial [Elusimicrobia bacterium]|nr:HAMP domain-containing histidine kinase [Elusimicrobiota bacterium]